MPNQYFGHGLGYDEDTPMLTSSIPLNNTVGHGAVVHPSSFSSGWKTLNGVTGAPFVLTGATAVTPGALGSADLAVASPSRAFYREQGRGTNLRIRIIYDDDATAMSGLTYRVWGRKNPSLGETAVNEDWQVLPNRDGNMTVTPTFDVTNDVVIATDYRATGADIDECTHDCDGNDEFFIEIVSGLSQTNGTASQARFQVKFI